MYIGMLWPLFLSAIGFSLGFAAIVMARLRAAVDGAPHPRPADGPGPGARLTPRMTWII